MTADPLMVMLEQRIAEDPQLAPLAAALGHSDGGADRQQAVTSAIGQILQRREQSLTEELGQLDSGLDQPHAEEFAQQAARESAADAERVHRLREGVEALTAALHDARALLAEIALSLGACPGCWGEDTACGWCHGHGRPGFVPPEPERFRRIVLPAVRLQAQLSAPRPRTAQPPAPSTEKGLIP